MGPSSPTSEFRPRPVQSGRRPPWPREVGWLVAAAVVYFGGRILVQGSEARSVANAEQLLDLETFLRIDVEPALQELALDSQLLERVGNLSYVWLHWPLLLSALALLFFRSPPNYRRVRNALFASGSIGLVLFAVVPMAPPRFMPGFVGTVSDDARRHYLGYPLSWANKYAAFPSFHVGWTLIACLAVAATLDRRWIRIVAMVPALLVGLAVITTGNHYVLDSVAGGGIALVAYVAAGSALWSRPVRTVADEAPTTVDRVTGGEGPAAGSSIGPMAEVLS